MYITSMQIENYKSYLKSDEIEFSLGFNVIVGANNAGKTSLLECLTLNVEDRPHLSLKTKQSFHSHFETNSELRVTFQITKDDFIRATQGVQKIIIKYSAKRSNSDSVARKDYQRYFQIGQLPRLIALVSQKGHLRNIVFNYSDYENAWDSTAAINFTRNNESSWVGGATSSLKEVNSNHLFEFKIANRLKSDIYIFSAERFSVSKSPVGEKTDLQPNASNLPEVLQYLRSNRTHVWQQYLDAIKDIFPEITDITLRPSSNGKEIEINIWTTDPALDRDDLARPLAESGTGIGQVLAMLYVLFTSKYPRILLIDEPQSFLHPGAIRKLFEIFKRHDVKHQYIVTTHSPLVITAANPDRIILLQKEDAETKVYPIKKSEKAEMERVLHSVGAGLSDVFGADNVLWVEGQTEAKCYPLIIRELCESLLLGTTVVEVQHTGDFEDDKKVQQVKPLYEKLTQGNALIPPAVGFIFDRETKTQKQVADLERMGIKFLKRRMYENYLLNPSAIASVLSQSPYLQGKQFTPQQVVDWFDNNLWEEMVSGVKQWNKKYFDKFPSSQVFDDEALTLIHGANVLNDLFVALTGDTSLKYYKIEHGYELTEWFVANDKAALNEVKELLDNCLGKKS